MPLAGKGAWGKAAGLAPPQDIEARRPAPRRSALLPVWPLHNKMAVEVLVLASLLHFRVICCSLIAKEDQCVSVRIANAELSLPIGRIVNIFDEFESLSLFPYESGLCDFQLARLENRV